MSRFLPLDANVRPCDPEGPPCSGMDDTTCGIAERFEGRSACWGETATARRIETTLRKSSQLGLNERCHRWRWPESGFTATSTCLL